MKLVSSRSFEFCASVAPAKRQYTKRMFSLSQWPGIVLLNDIWHDVYKGSLDALTAANLVAPWQFPGKLGCGKVCTTFGRDGRRVIQGSKTARQEGARTVLISGKQFEVWVRVSDDEGRKRLDRWHSDRDLAAQAMQCQASPSRPRLRLVWSAAAGSS